MSAVVRIRDPEMKCSAAGLIVLAALALTSCSRPVNVSEMAANFRDKVTADHAVAVARRAMKPRPEQDIGNHSRPKPPAPGTPGAPSQAEADLKPGAAIPGGPTTYQPAPAVVSAPPTIYYYPAPTTPDAPK